MTAHVHPGATRAARPDPGRDITVVIPTVGRPILAQCLESIATGLVRPSRVIVVDQGDAAAVAPILARAEATGLVVEHVVSVETGRARAVNRGLERAGTRFVAITDDDCLVAADWLVRVADRLARHPGCVVTGRVVAEEGAVGTLSLSFSSEAATYRRPRLRGDILMGGNMALGSAIVERIGGLDEDDALASAEDCEWCYRMLRAGIPIVYAPEVRVTHLGWRTAEQRARRWDDYARSIGGFYGRHLDGFLALRAALDLGRGVRRWLRGVVRHDDELRASGRAYVIAMPAGVVAGLRHRR